MINSNLIEEFSIIHKELLQTRSVRKQLLS